MKEIQDEKNTSRFGFGSNSASVVSSRSKQRRKLRLGEIDERYLVAPVTRHDRHAIVRRRGDGVRRDAHGALSHERTGRGSDDTTSTSDNDLLAPESPGVAHLVAVLRDDRGGVAVTPLSLDVE